MDDLRRLLSELRDFDLLLFRLGNTDITVVGLFKFALLLALLFSFTARIDRWMMSRVLARTHLEMAARLTVAAVVRYLLLLMGFLAILQTLGINLTSLNVLAGALGVGVGFGLQNIVSNFVSGLIIMFEGLIKVGDQIVIGAIEGEVTEIGARRTTVLTRDNVSFIVPNQRFITENVANLRYRDEVRVRVHVDITVPAGADAGLVRRLLLEAAQANPHVLPAPPPRVHLLAYRDNGALHFELLAWNVDLVGEREALVSELNFDIGERLAKNGVKLG